MLYLMIQPNYSLQVLLKIQLLIKSNLDKMQILEQIYMYICAHTPLPVPDTEYD